MAGRIRRRAGQAEPTAAHRYRLVEGNIRVWWAGEGAGLSGILRRAPGDCGNLVGMRAAFTERKKHLNIKAGVGSPDLQNSHKQRLRGSEESTELVCAVPVPSWLNVPLYFQLLLHPHNSSFNQSTFT